jgi:hypothetical protein
VAQERPHGLFRGKDLSDPGRVAQEADQEGAGAVVRVVARVEQRGKQAQGHLVRARAVPAGLARLAGVQHDPGVEVATVGVERLRGVALRAHGGGGTGVEHRHG